MPHATINEISSPMPWVRQLQRARYIRRMRKGPTLDVSCWLRCMLLQLSANLVLYLHNFNNRSFVCFRRGDGLRYSPYVDTCCDFLLSQSEYGSDRLLATAVRLQCIISRMHDIFTIHATSNAAKAPLGLHVNIFRGELEAFNSSLPFDIQQDCK
jgi:hypothetical protein